jgi:hypothetical protein
MRHSFRASWSIEGSARGELGQRFAWVLELDRLSAVGYLADFVRRHPGVFARLVKEQFAARMSKRRPRPIA